jgi:hypothetical protein
MSLPSIPVIAQEKGFNLAALSASQREDLLVEAMRRDLPLAVDLLHRKAHEDGDNAGNWLEDPNSIIGKQLIRLHASDALRPLASKHFCHGKPPYLPELLWRKSRRATERLARVADSDAGRPHRLR